MGVSTFREVARDAKATVRIKGIVLVNIEIYDLIVETVVGKGESMTISGQKYSRELVKSRFLKRNMPQLAR